MPPPIVRRLVFVVLAVTTVIWVLQQHGRLRLANPFAAPFTWARAPFHHSEPAVLELPWLANDAHAPPSPPIQAAFKPETQKAKAVRLERLAAVRDAFRHTWQGYKDHAWLHDELRPLSGQAADPFGGWGATLVDSLDTLWIMEEYDEFDLAVDAVRTIDFTRCSLESLSTFETTIRFLGGLLSAYDVACGTSGKTDADLQSRRARYHVLLEKATEVGEMMYRAFDTPNNMPIPYFKWHDARNGHPQVQGSTMAMAELGSLSLEFTRLSQLTGNPKYYAAVQAISQVLHDAQNSTRLPGLWPLVVNPRSLDFGSDNTFTMGGMVDSVYEYLPKMALLLQHRAPMYERMWHTAARTAKEFLLFEPALRPVKDLAPLALGTTESYGPLAATTENPRSFAFRAEGQHLTCFAGGLFALAARAFAGAPSAAEDAEIGARLTDGCIWTYLHMASGLGPEIWRATACRKGRAAASTGQEADWDGQHGDCTWHKETGEAAASAKLPAGMDSVVDGRYILRPEAIESVFVLHRTTGAAKWADMGWRMFEAVQRHCRTPIGYAAVEHVDATVRQVDSAESFWTGETLKYFYLLYSEPGLLSLDEWVLNTEAHPFRWHEASGGGR